jgi:hypothetical protein
MPKRVDTHCDVAIGHDRVLYGEKMASSMGKEYTVCDNILLALGMDGVGALADPYG